MGVSGYPILGQPGVGRPKGSLNKVQKKQLALMEEWREERGWLDPLEFMVATMNNPTVEMDCRIECAKSAAPFLHRKQPMDVALRGGGPAGATIMFVLPDNGRGDAPAPGPVALPPSEEMSHGDPEPD